MKKSSKKHWRLFPFLAKHLITNFVLPTKRLLFLAAVGILVVGIGFALGIGFLLLWAVNGLLIAFSILDVVTMPRRSQFAFTRQLPEQSDIRQPFAVSIMVDNKSNQPVELWLQDDLPYEFAPMELLHARIGAGEQELSYQTLGKERGLYTFSSLYVRFSGWIGLWAKQTKVEHAQTIKILPDLSAVRGYLASSQESLVLDGQRVFKRQTAGSEFHAIREYVLDDDPRKINWSATARASKLMTNLHRPERGKLVTLLIDCGRMMGVELEQETKLDLSLEAALTLAAVALRQGDQVAVLAYSSHIKRYVPPGRGLTHLHAIIEAVYDLRSDFVESNHAFALSYFMRQLKKRSLVAMFSDMESYLLEDQLQAYLLRLRKNHQLLLLSLQDPLLFAWSRTPITTSKLAYRRSTAYQLLMRREDYKNKMIGKGIQVLDVGADQLALAVVNRYLELKAKDLL